MLICHFINISMAVSSSSDKVKAMQCGLNDACVAVESHWSYNTCENYNYGLKMLCSADCSSRLEVSDGGRIVARLCDVTSGDRGGESRRTFHYNTTTATSLTVDYYVRDGQMQADPLKGFWLSFRWIPAGK